MKNTIKYVGLDVSKDKIAVAIADEGREPARYYGAIPHTPDAVARMIRKLKGSEITLEQEIRESGAPWLNPHGVTVTAQQSRETWRND